MWLFMYDYEYSLPRAKKVLLCFRECVYFRGTSNFKFMRSFLLLSFVIICCVSCRTESPQSQFASLSVDYSHVTDEYVQRIDEADSSIEVAQALNAYSGKIEKILPELVELSSGHPEFIQGGSGLVWDAQLRMGDVSVKLGKSFLKISNYMDDPEVESAQRYLMEVMQILGS